MEADTKTSAWLTFAFWEVGHEGRNRPLQGLGPKRTTTFARCPALAALKLPNPERAGPINAAHILPSEAVKQIPFMRPRVYSEYLNDAIHTATDIDLIEK